MIGRLIRPNQVGYVRPEQIYCGDFELDRNSLQLLNQQFPLLLLELSRENYGIGNEYIYDECERLGLNFVILTHDVYAHLSRPRMCYYPHWYYTSADLFTMGTANPNPRHRLSCINRNPKRHRILNYFLLREKPYWSDSLVTLYQPMTNMPTRFDDFDLSLEIQQAWQDTVSSLPQWKKNVNASYDLNIPAFTNSWFHLVTESTCSPEFFVTEKIWKPIAAQQLFMVYGAPRIIEYLRSAGVDVFDDIIDHKYYDLEPDPVRRLHLLHEVLDHMMNQDLSDLYEKTVERRQQNQKKFFDRELNQTYYQDLAKVIKQCTNSPN